MVVTLALMSAFTLAAGVAVATLMPARLALWSIPRVVARSPAAASQVLPGARSSAPLPTSRGLSAALSGILGSRVLGKQAGVPVSLHTYPDDAHAFFSFVNIMTSGNEAVAAVGAEVREMIAAASD